MSEDNKFVVLSENINSGSWAAEDSDGDHDRDVKQPSKKARGNAQKKVEDDAPLLSDIFREEETQKKEKDAQKQANRPYRAPKGAVGNNNNRPVQAERDQPFNDFRTREKIPIPNDPPFTAFVGNLSFEVSKEDLEEYFEDLGIANVKIMKDEEDKPRGYAYIEFHSKEGLTKALLASGAPFKGRVLNMDVAKPSRNATSRPSNNNTREFGERDKERYDNNWGPSANRNPNSNYGGGGSGGGYPNRSSYSNRTDYRQQGERPTERPRLNLNPPAPKPSAQATELHDNISKPKGSFENPFGTAIVDRQRMDEMSQARLAKDLEREKNVK